MVVSAIEEAARLLRRLDLDVCLYTSSGSCVEAGIPLLQAAGPAARLHLGWKTAQTLVEWASGIASSVHQIALAARAERPDVVVACTRKTVPLNRALTIKAVLAGGGTMHRCGLGDTILLFAEHRTFLPGMSDADLVDRLRANAPERKLTAEVSNVEAALRMARVGIDVLQLEKICHRGQSRNWRPRWQASHVDPCSPLPAEGQRRQCRSIRRRRRRHPGYLGAVFGPAPRCAGRHHEGSMNPMQQAPSDSETLAVFFKIAELWSLTRDEQINLLGSPSPSTFFNWQRDGGPISIETAERISHIVSMFGSLQMLFPDPEQADAWLRKPSKYWYGRSAIDVMLGGRITDIYVARTYLDTQLGS